MHLDCFRHILISYLRIFHTFGLEKFDFWIKMWVYIQKVILQGQIYPKYDFLMVKNSLKWELVMSMTEILVMLVTESLCWCRTWLKSDTNAFNLLPIYLGRCLQKVSPTKVTKTSSIAFLTNLLVIKMFESFECVRLHKHFGLCQKRICIKKPRSSISRARTFRARYFYQKQNFRKFLRNFHVSFFLLFRPIRCKLRFVGQKCGNLTYFSQKFWLEIFENFTISDSFSKTYILSRINKFQSLRFSCLGFSSLAEDESLDE